MILADKIFQLRKKNGWSQEELARKLKVSRQSISKWESAQAIPDLERILTLGEVFGVSTDLLMKDELEIPDSTSAVEVETEFSVRRVTLAEAQEFLVLKYRSAKRVGLAVALFIISPVLLLLMTGAQEARVVSLSETAASTIGITVLLLLVVAGVGILVYQANPLEKFSFLEKEIFETEYGVAGLVEQRKLQFRAQYLRQNVEGIALAVCSPIPLLFAGIFEKDQRGEFYVLVGVAFLLLMVAIGVYLLVSAGIVNAAHAQLLQEGDFSPQRKERSRILGPISGVYWLTATVIYLFISFYYESWDLSWLLWPIAGMIFAIIVIAVNAFLGRDELKSIVARK